MLRLIKNSQQHLKFLMKISDLKACGIYCRLLFNTNDIVLPNVVLKFVAHDGDRYRLSDVVVGQTVTVELSSSIAVVEFGESVVQAIRGRRVPPTGRTVQPVWHTISSYMVD